MTRGGSRGARRGPLARGMLARSLRSHPRDVAWLAIWSLAEALPSLVSGWAVSEPLRDDLVELIVAGALRRSLAAPQRPDTDAVARITHQTEIVRDAYAGLLSVARTFVFTAG